MVVHGIPGAVTLAEGDILSVDVGVTLDGFVADSAWTFPVGAIGAEARHLLEVCEAALEAGHRTGDDRQLDLATSRPRCRT